MAIEHTPQTRYKKLPGKGPRSRGIITAYMSRCYLYQADDHLLSVENSGFSESYRRFYFADIQAFITRKTQRGKIINILLLIPLAPVCYFALKDPAMFYLYFGIFMTACLLINVLRGPTCVCSIMTAVQLEELPSLNRLKIAEKVMAILRSCIEKAQGPLAVEEITAPGYAGNNAAAPPPILPRLKVKKRPIKHYDGAMHLTGFALMLIYGLLNIIELFYHTKAGAGMGYMVGGLFCIAFIIALAKQHESDIPSGVKSITWSSLGFIIISYGLAYALMFTAMFSTMKAKPSALPDEFALYRALLELSPQKSSFLFWVDIFSAVCGVSLGSLGMLRVLKFRGIIQRTTPDDRMSGQRP